MPTSVDFSAFDAALRRYILQTGKESRAAATRQLRNLLIQARAAIPCTPRAAIPNLADGQPWHCRLVAWHLKQRGLADPTTRQLRAKARALTNTRRSHARFGRIMFSAAIASIRSTARGAAVSYTHLYKTPLTGALQPRGPSARHWQEVIDRAIRAAIPRATADMLSYLSRRLAAHR